MRSLFAKTLLWFLATTTVAILGIIITTALTFTSTEPRGPFGTLLTLQVEEAKRGVRIRRPTRRWRRFWRSSSRHEYSRGFHGRERHGSADRPAAAGVVARAPARAAGASRFPSGAARPVIARRGLERGNTGCS